MLPPTRSNNPPRFAEEMTDSQFEELCRDLFGREQGLTNCVRYGNRGQKQCGIDLLAEREHGGNEVAQCKCYKSFNENDLKTAAADFLQSIEHWRTWGIKRFVLMVGSSVSGTKVQNEKQFQRAKFEALGIRFELWGNDRLTEKLRPHPDLVEIHIGSAWVLKICGSTYAAQQVSKAVNDGAARGIVGDILMECADNERGEAGHKFSAIREMARSGKAGAAFAAIEQYRHSPKWALLDPRTQGYGLRLAASLHLDHLDSIDGARELMTEAKRLAPEQSYQVIESNLAYRLEGRNQALSIVAIPADLDGWNMKLALLVEDGRSDKVLTEIGAAPFVPNANTWRIASIAALIQKNFTVAREYALRALEEGPNWFLVRFHAAKMDYLATLLPHYPMIGHLSWPVPPEREYLRLDGDSLKLLDRAANALGRILADMEEGDSERTFVEGWRLACLANHPARREEAAEYCRLLLKSFPAHLPAAVWALARGFLVDRKAVSAALAQRGTNSGDQGELQTSCLVLMQDSTPVEALAALDEMRPAFEKRDALFSWRLLKAQVAEDAGETKLSAQLVEDEADDLHRLQMKRALLRVRLRKTGNGGDLSQELAENFDRNGDPQDLFAAFEALAREGREAEAVKWTDELLTLFPTASGFTLALEANFGAGKFGKCLEIFENAERYFSDQRLPARLVRVKIECLRQVGHITKANTLAEKLAKQEESTSTLLALFQTQLTLGDFKGCVITARGLRGRKDVSILELLQLASAIHPEDAGLSEDFWREAVRRGIKGASETAVAVNLAFRFGLDEEVKPLLPNFFSMASHSTGVVKSYTFEQVKDLMREQGERNVHAHKVFNEGVVPMHLVASALNAPLAAILFENMRLARECGRLHELFPVLIRPGTKAAILDSVSLRPGELFMDITALYIAEELGLLDVIEANCAPVWVSAHTPELLQAEIHRATPHQPALQQPRIDVLHLFDAGAIAALEVIPVSQGVQPYVEEMGEEWSYMLVEARRTGGVVCDFTPLHGCTQLLVLEAADASHIVSCGDLVRSLQTIGEVSAERAAQAMQKLGDAGLRFNEEIQLSPGTLIILDIGIAEQLAGAKVLESLTRVFNVRMAQRAISHLRAEVADFGHQLALAAKLKGLAERIRQGLVSGSFKPLLAALKRDEKLRNDFSDHYLNRCLLSLLDTEHSGVKAVWVDDRYLLSFNNVGKVGVAGVSDILKTLRKQGVLTRERYFELLLDLRSRNARYLPLESEEVGEHIEAAAVVNGRVYETKALVVLRRYFASCFSDWDRVRPPIKTKNGVEPAEFAWVIGAVKAVAEAIAKLWTLEDLSEGERVAKADWLLHNLYASYAGVVEAVTREPASGGVLGLASAILLLLSAGFVLPSSGRRSQSDQAHPRARYYSWISKNLIETYLQTEPDITRELAMRAKRLFLDERKTRGSKKIKQISRVVAVELFLDLPKALQEAMQLDLETCKWLGLRLSGPTWQVSACGRAFPAAGFWRAIAGASKGRVSKVTSSDTLEEFQIGPAGENKNALQWVRLSGPDLPEGHHIRDNYLRLLSGSKAEQQDFLGTRKDWLDCKEEQRKELIERITEPDDPAERMGRLADAQEASAAWCYRKLWKMCRSSRAITTPECLPVSADALCAHLRLDREDLMQMDAQAKAAQTLVADVGLAAAIERLAPLPILLPDSLIWATRNLNPGEFRTLISRLKRKLRSPMARLHLFNIVAERCAIDEGWIETTFNLREELFAEHGARDSWKSFRRLLGWSKDQIQAMHCYRDLSSHTKLLLIWLHAGRLFDTLTLAGADSGSLMRAFDVWTLAHGVRLENHETDFCFDAMNPRFAGRLPVIIRAFGAILARLPTELAHRLKLDHLPWSPNDAEPEPSVIMLFRDHTILKNHYGSFLGTDVKELMLHAMAAEAVEEVLGCSPSQIISVSLDSLETAINDARAWRVLALALADAPTHAEQADRMHALLLRGMEAGVLGDLDDGGLLIFFTSRVQYGVSDALKEKIEDAVWKRLVSTKARASGESAIEHELDLLLTCFASLATVPQDDMATYLNFYKYVARLAKMWPEAASVMGGASGWPVYLPIATQTGYWQAAMAIRASSNSLS